MGSGHPQTSQFRFYGAGEIRSHMLALFGKPPGQIRDLVIAIVNLPPARFDIVIQMINRPQLGVDPITGLKKRFQGSAVFSF